MSLFRQLWLAVIISTLVAFAGSFLVSVYTARNYLQQQLFTQSADAAGSLAVSMSQQTGDPAMVQLLLTSVFDNGHFQLIRYTDVHGKIQVERTNHTAPDGVPDWFTNLFMLEARPGTAQVSNGWMQAGSVTVVAHTRFAYQALWQGAVQLFCWMLGAGVVAGLMGSILLRDIKRSMGSVVDQAQAISERRFLTIAEPRIPELRSLAQAMNTMVVRLKAMFAEQAARIEQLRLEANSDLLTGLANKPFFESRLTSALQDDDAAPDGVLMMVRIFDLASLNRRLGREKTDAFLKATAQRITDAISGHEEYLAARLGGPDFAVLMPAATPAEARGLAQELLDQLSELFRLRITDQDNVAHIGAIGYQRNDRAADIWLRTESAVQLAEAEGPNRARMTEQRGADMPSETADWETRFKEALAQGHFQLGRFPALDAQGKLIHDELLLRLKQAGTDTLLPAGTFMPFAARLGLIPELDLEVVRLALIELQAAPRPLAINLAAASVLSVDFRTRLLERLQQHPTLLGHLWFEVSEHGFRDELSALARFTQTLRPLGCKVGIEHFGRHFNSVPKLHELGLDYLKIDGSFIAGIHANRGNQNLVKAIADIANSLDIRTIAERVESDADWATLETLGIDGLTGPLATRRAAG